MKLYVIALFSLVLLATPNFVMATQMTDMFCQAYRLGLASPPQQSAMCSFLGQNLLGQLQQSSAGVNTNPCPTGFVLSGVQCVPTNTAATTAAQQQTTTPVVTCTTPNSVVTPIVSNAGLSQAAATGSLVTLSAVGSTPSVVTTGFGVAATCSTEMGTLTSFSWQQTSGPAVNLTSSTSQTTTFIAPRVASTLAFSLVVQDSNSQVSSPAITTVSVQ